MPDLCLMSCASSFAHVGVASDSVWAWQVEADEDYDIHQVGRHEVLVSG